jgi:hypothetical protein
MGQKPSRDVRLEKLRETTKDCSEDVQTIALGLVTAHHEGAECQTFRLEAHQSDYHASIMRGLNELKSKGTSDYFKATARYDENSIDYPNYDGNYSSHGPAIEWLICFNENGYYKK